MEFYTVIRYYSSASTLFLWRELFSYQGSFVSYVYIGQPSKKYSYTKSTAYLRTLVYPTFTVYQHPCNGLTDLTLLTHFSSVMLPNRPLLKRLGDIRTRTDRKMSTNLVQKVAVRRPRSMRVKWSSSPVLVANLNPKWPRTSQLNVACPIPRGQDWRIFDAISREAQNVKHLGRCFPRSHDLLALDDPHQNLQLQIRDDVHGR